MVCYYPIDGFRSKTVNPSGRRGIVFNPSEGYPDLPLQVPCGQCIGCKLAKSKQWALRCQHEASLHDDNIFVTLTYTDDNLPPFSSLRLSDFQNFMKRLRKKVGSGVRYYHCGEYGENTARPHYHAILFNLDFPDKIHHMTSGNGNRLFTSETLTNIWGLGHAVIGNVTFESAAYVARYCLKKITGEMADEHYLGVDHRTGEIGSRQPEYATMSRRPGIGTGWYQKYQKDVFPHDYVVSAGAKQPTPKFYDTQLERDDPTQIKKIKARRKRSAARHAANNTRARLEVREVVQHERAKRLKRGLE